ncbi:hypothetical protein TRIUR3_31169 [Triticum urartu]|uniref:Uncharacterized protein n=1 Tax=Triticum urartu TaxID=4572 RepID=M7ZCS8_TRIUA|nr:hypothetical protein TRIUR3_31169 [Triticum urartu]
MASIEPWCKWFFLQSSTADQLPSPEKLALWSSRHLYKQKDQGVAHLNLFSLQSTIDLTTVGSSSVYTQAWTHGGSALRRLPPSSIAQTPHRVCLPSSASSSTAWLPGDGSLRLAAHNSSFRRLGHSFYMGWEINGCGKRSLHARIALTLA